ncbi:MAG: hypothetical protein WB797_05505 [Nocardioides sp.]
MRRWGRFGLIAFVLVVVNLPYAVHVWQLHRAETDGLRVTAPVLRVTPSGGDALLDFRMPASVDAKQTVHEVKVDAATGASAARTHRIGVQVLGGHPAVFHVDGQIRSRTSAIVIVVADLLIVAMVLLRWRLGGRLRRPPLEAVALADVESGEEGSLLDKQADGSYVINGEIAAAGPESMVLTLRDRDVTVHLRGHHNPVAVGESAQVRAHLVG